MFLVYVVLDTCIYIYVCFFRYIVQSAPQFFSVPFCPPAFHVQPGALWGVKTELILKGLGQPAAPRTLRVFGSTRCWTSPHGKDLGDNKAKDRRRRTAHLSFW